MRSRRVGAVLAAGVVSVLVLGACTDSGDSASPSSPSSPTVSTAPTASTAATTAPATTTDSSPAPTAAPTAPTATAAPTAALARFYAQKPDWQPCPDASAQSFVTTAAQCATIEVPLDYAKPAAGTIKLALDRIPAADQKKRIGSLLVNPGGPGGSGLDYAKAADRIVGKPLLDRFDLVGFDPRGVGESTPVKCLSDAQLDTFIALDPAPDTPAEVKAAEAQAKLLADGCEAESARLLPHVGTPDAARDMDVIRAVVGDAKLNYLGKSYGTFLGATYAGLFPTKVGRVVLDGAIDPALSSDQLDLGQAGGFQTAVEAFLADWVGDAGSPLGDTVAKAQAKLGQLLAGVVAKPLPTGTDRQLQSGQAFLGVVAPLYDKQSWPALREALVQLSQGRGDDLLRFSDLYSDRGPSGYTSNANEVIYAVNCLDRPEDETAAQVQALVPAFEKASPVFGSALAWSSLPCSDWPVRPARGPARISAPGAAPILVVGTTRDPATPYAWAVSLAKQLSSGVLLTRDGDGHTGYFMGNACIDAKVEAYLLDGTPPADGTRCAAS